MQRKVLVIEDTRSSLNLVVKLVEQAGLEAVCAGSLEEAKLRFGRSNPEDYLCAIVDYHLPDAPNGEAIDFTIDAYIPSIVVTAYVDDDTRQSVLRREVVDYIPKENAQVYDYLSRLLSRMEKNKQIGVLIIDPKRRSRASMGSLLRRHNICTFEAASAKDGLTFLEEHPNIKIALVDASVTDMSPTQLIADLRRSYTKEELAIIGLSEDTTALFSARFIKSGANDFLRKPFCHEEFLCRITQSLEMIENVDAIRKAANTDYLTGLPNRRHFFYTFNQIKRQQPKFQALALVDLDFFKRINDSYGHDAGDIALKHVAKEIGLAFGDMLAARFGGEEFCIYFAGLSAPEVLVRLNAFRQSIARQVLKHQEHTFSVTASIGVTLSNDNNLEALLSTADKLLYKAKDSGRNVVMSDLPKPAKS